MQRKWVVLSNTLVAEGKYVARRITPRKLSEQSHKGLAAIIESEEVIGDRTIQAYAALWPTNVSFWFELGTVWVCKALRGSDKHEEIMREVVRRVPANTCLFLITDRQRIMDVAATLGFKPITRAVKPGVGQWSERLGFRERLPETALRTNTPDPKDGERWLFIRRRS